jgi:hypothetical protein
MHHAPCTMHHAPARGLDLPEAHRLGQEALAHIHVHGSWLNGSPAASAPRRQNVPSARPCAAGSPGVSTRHGCWSLQHILELRYASRCSASSDRLRCVIAASTV